MERLKVAVVPNSPFLEVNLTSKGDHALSGIDGKLLKLLSEILHFQYQLVLPEDLQWGKKKEDGNWTGMIGMVAREEADIALDFISITEQRQEVVDFTFPYFLTDTTFFTKVPQFLPKTKAYLYPFENSVWLCFIAAFIIVPIIFYGVVNAGKKHYSFCTSACYLYGTVFNLHSNGPDKTLTVKIFLYAWMVFFQIACLSFTAVHLSFLTVPLTEPSISTVEELRRAIFQETATCTFYLTGTSIESNFINSEAGVLKDLADHMRKTGSLNIPWKFNRSESTDSKRLAIIESRIFFDLEFDINWNQYEAAKDSFFPNVLGIATKKNFCCKAKFDKIIHRIAAAGIYDKFVSDHTFKTNLISRRGEKLNENEKPLSLKDISGAFVVLLSGYALASITLLVETIWHTINANPI